MRGKTRSTKAAIEEAVSRVLDGGESIEQVAATSAVHVLTIRKYLNLRKQQANGDPAVAAAAAAATAPPARRGRKPALDPVAEQELLDHVLQLAAQGAEVTCQLVLQLATDKVLQTHGESAPRQALTLSWLRRFKERHPSLPVTYIPAVLPSDALAHAGVKQDVNPGMTQDVNSGLSQGQVVNQTLNQGVNQFSKMDGLQMQPNPQLAAVPAPQAEPMSDSLSKRGRKPMLDMQAELDIMNALQQLEAQGQRITSDMIRNMASEKVREITGGATAPALSMSWLQRFKERHPTLFSDRVRQKRGREDEDLDLAAGSRATPPGETPPAAQPVRNVRPRPSDAFHSPLAAAATLAPSTALNGRATGGSQSTDELLKSLVRMSEKIVDMQNRQLEVLVKIVDAVKEKHV